MNLNVYILQLLITMKEENMELIPFISISLFQLCRSPWLLICLLFSNEPGCILSLFKGRLPLGMQRQRYDAPLYKYYLSYLLNDDEDKKLIIPLKCVPEKLKRSFHFLFSFFIGLIEMFSILSGLGGLLFWLSLSPFPKYCRVEWEREREMKMRKWVTFHVGTRRVINTVWDEQGQETGVQEWKETLSITSKEKN